MQAVGCSPMHTDVQPTRLGRLHAVMEMSTLDASLDGTHISGSFTQLVTHLSPPVYSSLVLCFHCSPSTAPLLMCEVLPSLLGPAGLRLLSFF